MEFYTMLSYVNTLQTTTEDLDLKSDLQTKAQNLRSFNEFSAFYGINLHMCRILAYEKYRKLT